MLNKKALAATAAAQALYVEDVFSTYLYTGNAASRTITNGIDLSGEGGLVWLKGRSAIKVHGLFDTVRGATKSLRSDSTNAEDTGLNSLTAFNSDGFNLGTDSDFNAGSGATFASWTFRKAEKFFDVVTYTGNGTAGRTVSHNLGSVPGVIIVKCTSTSPTSWRVYHRSLGATKWLQLQATDAADTDSSSWNDTAPTSTQFTVGNVTAVNGNGETYVAYLFAHDAGGFGDSGSDNVISCGSFTTDGGANATVNLGYEPQWLMFKKSSGASSWIMVDNMRGWPVGTGDAFLYADQSSAESNITFADYISPTATGFQANALDPGAGTYIYIAIRRGPMKTPEAGTEVFAAQISDQTGSSTSPEFTSGFPVDSYFVGQRSGTDKWYWLDRLRGDYPLNSASTAAEGSFLSAGFDFNNGVYDSSIVTSYYATMFRRAPGFFDVVCYTGNGSGSRAITHNLGVTPELVIVKQRTGATDHQWWVLSTSGPKLNVLNSNSAADASGVPANLFGDSTYNNYIAPTSTTVTLSPSDEVNASTYNYVMYLFASVTGVSKVGSYTGNGSSQTINCGFTGGSRFVLIKRTDSTGDWVVFDSARGIVSGNDPYLELNTTDAEVTDKDAVDTDNTGFVVNETTGPNINTNGGTYIYLAIA